MKTKPQGQLLRYGTRIGWEFYSSCFRVQIKLRLQKVCQWKEPRWCPSPFLILSLNVKRSFILATYFTQLNPSIKHLSLYFYKRFPCNPILPSSCNNTHINKSFARAIVMQNTYIFAEYDPHSIFATTKVFPACRAFNVNPGCMYNQCQSIAFA